MAENQYQPRRLITFGEDPPVEEEPVIDPPEFQRIVIHERRVYTVKYGVTRQRCGGGCRVIRKTGGGH